jgi:hypothetical protein
VFFKLKSVYEFLSKNIYFLSVRKIGYRQSIGYIMKDNKLENENYINFFHKNLNEFYLYYTPDTYSDVLFQFKKQKVFQDTDQEGIFQVKNSYLKLLGLLDK